MAQTSYPFPPNRIMTDAEYERLTHPIGADGIVGLTSDSAVVYADSSGMQIKVRTEKYGLVRGFAWESGDTEFTKPITANATSATRVDLVVLRLTRATWAVTIEVRDGSPGSGAPAAVQDALIHEIPVAEVTVPAGAVTIAAGSVREVCHYIAEPTIVCDSDTRPPHRQGRRIYEADTARSYISTGTGGRWLIIADDSGAATISLTSAFTSTHRNLYRRNGWGGGELTISRPGGQLNANTVYHAATIPSGFLPHVLFQVPGVVPGQGLTVVASVSTDGGIRINPGAKAIPAGYSIVLALGTWPVLY